MGRLLWSAGKFLLLTPLCVHAGSNARDSDLEQRGARIGAIEIQVDDVFESTTLVTLEQRFYTDWQPLKLFNVGAAVFFDAGRTWGHDAFAAPPAGWLKDVGLGLRLGSARSGLGNVLHIDLAFPLDRSSDIDSMQLLIETRKSF